MIQNSEQLKQGTKGEDLFEQWLDIRGYTKNVDYERYTYEDHPEQQRSHIDFKVLGHTVDVKWGHTVSKYGNITAEYKQIKYEVAGHRTDIDNNWLRDCKNEFMAYGDSVYRKFYLVDVERLRKFIANPENKKHFITKHMTNDGSIYSFFYAMPYAVLEGQGVIIAEICIGE